MIEEELRSRKDTDRSRSRQLQQNFEEGGDDKWLVSYADMITLLLGFFVVLFSMAMENRSEFEKNIRKMSMSQTELTIEAKKSEKIENEKTIDQYKLEMDQLKLQIEELNKVKVSFDDLQKLLEEKQTKLEQLQNELIASKSLDDQLKEKDAELAKLKEENIKLTKAFMDFQKLVRNSGETLRSIAEQASETLDVPIGDPVELSNKLKDALKTQKKLEEELFELKGPNGASQRFIFSVFKWETDRHDIDLSVIDTEGRVFDLQNKIHPGHSGKLILTSNGGPGAEIWEGNDPPVGIYTFQLTMRNNNGNNVPAKVSGMFQSNRSNIKIQGTLLQPQPGSKTEFKVAIDEKGMIRLVM